MNQSGGTIIRNSGARRLRASATTGALCAALLTAALAFAACGGSDTRPQQDAALQASPTATEPPPTPTPTPTETPTPSPSPTPEPPFGTKAGIVVGGPVPSYASPTTRSATVRSLGEYSSVTLVGQARGENWIVGDQTWPMAFQDWGTLWYLLDDGSYLYSAFVYVVAPDERSPLDYRGAAGRSVSIDLNAQRASAMVGGTVVRSMAITSGKPGFETPVGDFRVIGRVRNERMTSSQAGFEGPVDEYDVQRVLFTQYFAGGGYALHLNYWQPYSAFGGYRSSHGCVGFLLTDAQFLWMFGSGGLPVSIRGPGGRVLPTATPTPSPTPTPEPTPEATATATEPPAPAATPPNPFAGTLAPATPTPTNPFAGTPPPAR